MPSLQPDTAILKLVPVDESGVKEQPVAVPELEKSELVNPVIAWDMVIEYEMSLVVLVGVACEDVNVEGDGAITQF